VLWGVIVDLSPGFNLGRGDRSLGGRGGPLFSIFGDQGSGCRVKGAGFRVQGTGCRVQGAVFRVQGTGCRVQGTGCRVQGAGYRVQGIVLVLGLGEEPLLRGQERRRKKEAFAPRPPPPGVGFRV
jgi:hypothetical protein